jgi:hypothetical protein
MKLCFNDEKMKARNDLMTCLEKFIFVLLKNLHNYNPKWDAA